MPLGHEAAALAGVDVYSAQRIEQPEQRGACVSRTAAAEDEGTARRSEQIGGLRYALGIGQRAHPGFRLETLAMQKRRRKVRAQRIGRKVEIRRSRLVTFTQRTREGFIQLLQNERGLPDRA